MLQAAIATALTLLFSPIQDPDQISEDPNQGYDYPADWSGGNWQDDPYAPEPDPQFTIRPNVQTTVVGRSGGNVTIRFTGPVVVTVRPPFPISGGPRTSTWSAGSTYTGPDTNQNGVPDDLEDSRVDVRNQ
ncbi:MAG: hypothetical protein Q8M05_03870 [Rhodoferax sp.]|uniref:hypothetical protein n=1 Tax=Rhodoferax sp. TaxID=50421 RepID=UPI00273102C9|nr:hypothetical protein [Rhodoferax sp.]MDP1528500.1 hypothetical protein [Rhodoferax sp.]